MRCGLLLQMSHVVWSVCLSVSWSHGCILCKNRWTDRDAGWILSLVGPMNHVLDGVELSPPTGSGNFGGCSAHWKAIEVSDAVYVAKGIINSSITAWQCDCRSSVSRYIVPLVKNLPPPVRPFVEIIWPLVTFKQRTIVPAYVTS